MANLFDSIGETFKDMTSTENEEIEDDEDEEEEDGINPLLIVGGATVLGIGGYLVWRHFHPEKEGFISKMKKKTLDKTKAALKEDGMEIVDKADYEEYKKWKSEQEQTKNGEEPNNKGQKKNN